MNKRSDSSLVDFLIDLQAKTPQKTNTKLANVLFDIWKNKNNQIAKTIFKKPVTISNTEIENLQKEGLIEMISDKIKITAKGSEIIKVMILGDERSIFEENGEDIDYKFASEFVKTPSKLKKQGKKVEDLWWKQILSQKTMNRMDKKIKRLITNEISPIMTKYYDNVPLGEIFAIFHKYGIYPLQEDGTPWNGFLSGKKECGTNEANNQRIIFDLGMKVNNVMVMIDDCKFLLSWCSLGSGKLELNGYLT